MTTPTAIPMRGAARYAVRSRRPRTAPTTSTTPGRAAAYLRVSTEEQAREGVSLEAQEAKLRAYAIAQGFADVALFVDAGVSGSVPLADRPAAAAMLAELSDHIDHAGGAPLRHVVVYKLDRAFRDVVDCLHTVREWDRAGVALHLVDMGGQAVATSTAFGRFFIGMLAGVAELERNLIAERTSVALRHKVAKGERVGRAPYGYEATGDGTAWVPIPAELAVIDRVRRWRARGAPYAAIALRLTREGVPTKRGGTWHAGTVRQVLARSGTEGLARI